MAHSQHVSWKIIYFRDWCSMFFLYMQIICCEGPLKLQALVQRMLVHSRLVSLLLCFCLPEKYYYFSVCLFFRFFTFLLYLILLCIDATWCPTMCWNTFSQMCFQSTGKWQCLWVSLQSQIESPCCQVKSCNNWLAKRTNYCFYLHPYWTITIVNIYMEHSAQWYLEMSTK